MKFNIVVNQKALVETAKNLDIVDGAIIDYLIHFCSSDDKRIKQMEFREDGITYRYTWINYNNLIEQMPLLGIKQKVSISIRLRKISDAGFIKLFKAPNQNVYIRLTEKIKELYFSDTKAEPLVQTNALLVQTNSDHKFKLMDNNNIINNNEISNIYAFFKEKINPDARLTEKAKTHIKSRLKVYSEDELKHALLNFTSSKWWVERNGKRELAWFFDSDDKIERLKGIQPDRSAGVTIIS